LNSNDYTMCSDKWKGEKNCWEITKKTRTIRRYFKIRKVYRNIEKRCKKIYWGLLLTRELKLHVIQLHKKLFRLNSNYIKRFIQHHRTLFVRESCTAGQCFCSEEHCKILRHPALDSFHPFRLASEHTPKMEQSDADRRGSCRPRPSEPIRQSCRPGSWLALEHESSSRRRHRPWTKWNVCCDNIKSS